MAFDAFIDVELPVRTGLPEDSVHNTFAVSGGGVLEDHDVDIVQALDGFYNDDYAGTSMGIAHDLLGAQLAGTPTAMTIKIWDITGNLDLSSPLGAPDIIDDSVVLDTPFNPGLPSEVALVLSVRAAYEAAEEEVGSTRPRARRRGRLFIGPLTSGILVQTTPGIVRPSEDACNTLAGKFTDYLSALNANACTPTVWSRTDGANRPILFWHVDNAFDTQRRRGIQPDARFTG